MSPQAEADDFTIEFTTVSTILRILILEVVGTIFFQKSFGRRLSVKKKTSYIKFTS